MIKIRYLVQIGFSADVEETTEDLLPIESIRNGFNAVAKGLEDICRDEVFDCEFGKLTVTEILNEVTKE